MPRATLVDYMRRPLCGAAPWCCRPPATSTTSRMVDLVERLFARPAGARRRRAPSRRAIAAASSARTATSSRCTSCSAFPGVGYRRPRLLCRRRCSPRCWAAACPRACSRRSARSAASSTRSTPSPRAYHRRRALRHLRRHRRGRGGRAGAGAVRRDRPGRRRRLGRGGRPRPRPAQGRPPDGAGDDLRPCEQIAHQILVHRRRSRPRRSSPKLEAVDDAAVTPGGAPAARPAADPGGAGAAGRAGGSMTAIRARLA